MKLSYSDMIQGNGSINAHENDKDMVIISSFNKIHIHIINYKNEF